MCLVYLGSWSVSLWYLACRPGLVFGVPLCLDLQSGETPFLYLSNATGSLVPAPGF